MIKHHEINFITSKEVYEELKHLLEVKMCYNNVFHVVSSSKYIDMFLSGDWKIAYGYIRVLEGQPLITRHAFIIDEEERVIDPTLYTMEHFNENDYNYRQHTSFEVMDIDTYRSAIDENNYLPDLAGVLRVKEMKSVGQWVSDEGLFVI